MVELLGVYLHTTFNMFSSTVFVTLLTATSTLAAPHFRSYINRETSKAITKIDLPTSTLVAPADDLELKYVVLGYGTQNYTCTTTPNSATATPATAGAVANLYDASTILSMGPESAQTLMEQSLTALTLSIGTTFGITPDKFPGPLSMKQVGHHYFAAGSVPTFEVHGEKPSAQIQCKKNGDVPAPSNSFAGMNGEGAVDWLQLIDTLNGFSAGTALEGGDVYRVETAGGMAPKTCESHSAGIEVPYAALYFLYGKK